MAIVVAKKTKKICLDNKREKQDNRGKHLVDRGLTIKPGEVRNPAGRPKGSRNKLGEAFLSELLSDFEEYGAFAIADCRKEDPSAYCRIVASIIPKEININDEERLFDKFLEQFTTVEELKEFRLAITSLAAEECGSSAADTKARNKNKSRAKPDSIQ